MMVLPAVAAVEVMKVGRFLDTFEGSAKEDLLIGCGMGEAGKSQG